MAEDGDMEEEEEKYAKFNESDNEQYIYQNQQKHSKHSKDIHSNDEIDPVDEDEEEAAGSSKMKSKHVASNDLTESENKTSSITQNERSLLTDNEALNYAFSVLEHHATKQQKDKIKQYFKENKSFDLAETKERDFRNIMVEYMECGENEIFSQQICDLYKAMKQYDEYKGLKDKLSKNKHDDEDGCCGCKCSINLECCYSTTTETVRISKRQILSNKLILAVDKERNNRSINESNDSNRKTKSQRNKEQIELTIKNTTTTSNEIESNDINSEQMDKEQNDEESIEINSSTYNISTESQVLFISGYIKQYLNANVYRLHFFLIINSRKTIMFLAIFAIK